MFKNSNNPVNYANTTCFAYFDNHPSCNYKIDVIICTSGKEVIEYHDGEVVLSIALRTKFAPKDISIHRGTNCELYYIVLFGSDLFILERNEELTVRQKVSLVDKYYFDDPQCKGTPFLHVYYENNPVPSVFTTDLIFVSENINNEDTQEENTPLLTELSRKLCLARYNTAFNTKSLQSLKKLRQLAAFSIYQNIHPNLTDSVFDNGAAAIATAVKIKTESPWVKTCNENLVIVLPLFNNNEESLKEIKVLLHGNTTESMNYTVKLFHSELQQPYWREINTQFVPENLLSAIAVVIPKKEFENNLLEKLIIGGLIVYKIQGIEKLLPFGNRSLAILDIVSGKYDLLEKNNTFDKNDLLALIATSVKTDLIFYNTDNESNGFDLAALLCTYIFMERVDLADNIVMFRRSQSPLRGVMVVISDAGDENITCAKATVYSKQYSQVLTLIGCIQEAVPFKMLITTPNHHVTLQTDSRKEIEKPSNKIFVLSHTVSSLNQMSTLLKYYDKCMIKMNDSSNIEMRAKIGHEIDLFACGSKEYKVLKETLYKHFMSGISGSGAAEPAVGDPIQQVNIDSMVFDLTA